MEFEKMSVVELKAHLKSVGESTVGKKAELIERCILDAEVLAPCLEGKPPKAPERVKAGSKKRGTFL